MKKLIILGNIFLFSCTACTKYLEEQPFSFIAPENFYRNESDAIAAVNFAYAALAENNYYDQQFWRLTDIPSDNAQPGRNNNIELENFTWDANVATFELVWGKIYEAINRANTVIERVPPININEDVKKRIVAEAKFLRALHYFNLVRLWGEVPLVLEETKAVNNLNVSNATIPSIFQQIETDLSEAMVDLPPNYTSPNIGRATSSAARGLLGKVLLTQGKWQEAASTLQPLLNAGFSLFENPADIWIVNNKNTREHIFMIQYNASIADAGSSYNSLFSPSGFNISPGGGASEMVPTTSFVTSFKEGDARKDAAIRTSFTFSNGNTITFPPHFWKFYDPAPASAYANANNNYPILRFADILLMYAEALNEQSSSPSNEAYQTFNQVRRRAFRAPINTPSSYDLTTGLSREQFRDSILQERDWEFVSEGHRWFDLLRSGKMINVMRASGKPAEPKHNRFPIPQREIDINPNIRQNNGYE